MLAYSKILLNSFFITVINSGSQSLSVVWTMHLSTVLIRQQSYTQIPASSCTYHRILPLLNYVHIFSIILHKEDSA